MTTTQLYTEKIAEILSTKGIKAKARSLINGMELRHLTAGDLLQVTYLSLASYSRDQISEAIVVRTLYYRAIDACRTRRRKRIVQVEDLETLSVAPDKSSEFASDILNTFQEKYPEHQDLVRSWLAGHLVGEQSQILGCSERKVKRERAKIRRLLEAVIKEYQE